MEKNHTPITGDDWPRAAVAALVAHCTEQAAKAMEAQAKRLLRLALTLRRATR